VLKRGATTIATGPTELDFGVWYYVELQVTARDGTDGVYELRIDEVTEFSGSMVNLANTATDGVDVISFSSASTNTLWDDIYILDDQGGQNDDFLGDSAVRGILRRPRARRTPGHRASARTTLRTWTTRQRARPTPTTTAA
jgi:hypothetical protein